MKRYFISTVVLILIVALSGCSEKKSLKKQLNIAKHHENKVEKIKEETLGAATVPESSIQGLNKKVSSEKSKSLSSPRIIEKRAIPKKPIIQKPTTVSLPSSNMLDEPVVEVDDAVSASEEAVMKEVISEEDHALDQIIEVVEVTTID